MIPVVYCGNNKTFEGVFLSSISIARRTKEDLRIIILTMNASELSPLNIPITKEQAEKIANAVKVFNPDNNVELVDLTKKFSAEFIGGKNLKNHYTPYAFLRLFIDDESIVPFDKAIYLDIDTMATRDIKELWDTDIENYEYGACLDYMGKFWIHKHYCNSGVLLVNCKKIRQTGLFVKCREYVRTHSSLMPDQDALDRCALFRLQMDGKFNEQRDIKPETVIKHFNRGIKWFPFFHLYNIKQWDRKGVHEKLKITFFDEDYAFYDDFLGKNVDDRGC